MKGRLIIIGSLFLGTAAPAWADSVTVRKSAAGYVLTVRGADGAACGLYSTLAASGIEKQWSGPLAGHYTGQYISCRELGGGDPMDSTCQCSLKMRIAPRVGRTPQSGRDLDATFEAAPARELFGIMESAANRFPDRFSVSRNRRGEQVIQHYSETVTCVRAVEDLSSGYRSGEDRCLLHGLRRR